MISYQEALGVLQKVSKLKPITIATKDSCGFVAAETIISKVSVPPFDNSAMDGFAVRSADIAGASAESPITLQVLGSTVAGDTPSGGNEGGAWEIMTGAPVPEGYDSVVKIEDVTVNDNNISFAKPVEIHNNIRDAGEDFTSGDPIISAGTTITAMHIMALATIGKNEISVCPKPRITILSTGKEIIDDANAALLPGQIRNSNSPYLISALSEMGLPAQYGGIIHDEPAVFERKVQAMLGDNDIIISTGAVSMGSHDFIPDSLRKLGAEIIFHKVAIRPGKPILYAKFSDGTHYFGLPGNPVSASVGLRFFALPLLRKLQGQGGELPIMAKLLTVSAKKQGFRFFRKAYVAISKSGELQLSILKGQESFKIHPLLKANCWASFPAEQTRAEVDEIVEIYPLAPNKLSLDNLS